MLKRKIRLIDRRFQLKTTFTILGISIIAFLAIIALVAITASGNNRKIARTVSELNQAVEIEDRIVLTLLTGSVNEKAERDVLIREHRGSIDLIRQQSSMLDGFIRQNLLLISIIVAVVLLQSIALFFYLIRLTHRITGPIHVISMHMKDIMEGRDPQFRELREKDEFQEFYQNFCDMAEIIKDRD